MKKGFIKFMETIVHYKIHEQTGPNILFLHGNSMSMKYFQEQFKDPELQHFQLLAIDLPGHGDSPPALDPQETYKLFYFRDLVIALLQKLGVESFIFAGHSLGGHIAMECLPFVDNCRGLFLWGAPPVTLPLNTNAIYHPSPYINLLFTEDLSEKDISHLSSLLGSKAHQQQLHDMIKATDPAFRKFFLQSLADGNISDEYHLLKSSQIPVALIQGEHDALVNPAWLRQLELPCIWKKQIMMIPGSGHSPHMEFPSKFNQLLKQFVLDFTIS